MKLGELWIQGDVVLQRSKLPNDAVSRPGNVLFEAGHPHTLRGDAQLFDAETTGEMFVCVGPSGAHLDHAGGGHDSYALDEGIYAVTRQSEYDYASSETRSVVD